MSDPTEYQRARLDLVWHTKRAQDLQDTASAHIAAAAAALEIVLKGDVDEGE